MPNKEELEIVIDTDGNMSIEAHGYKGQACSTDVDRLIDELDAEDVSSTKKQEYYLKERKTLVKNKKK